MSARGRSVALCSSFLLVSLLIAGPGLSGPFISDDVLYLEHNAALRLPLLEAIRKLTLEPYYVVGNWSPVHQLLLLAEWRAFGDDPLPYRVVNAILHALVSLAVVLAGRRAGLSKGGALVAGSLFLVHPVAAEPVGWINQSKTLLAVGFALLSLERWLAWLDEPRRRHLVAATVLGGLALLAKPAALLLPAVLLLAAWTHGPAGAWRRAVLDLVPLGLIAGMATLLGIAAQAAQGGVAPWFGGSPLATAQILPWLTWRYVRLVFAPFDLVHGVHPEPVAGWLDERLVLPAAALAAVALLVVRACVARRERWLFAGWFAAMLLPVIQVIPMVNLFADRYLYAALPGALWLSVDVADRLARKRGIAMQQSVFGVAALVLVLFAGFAHGRARKWADPVRLYREAAIAYPQGRAGWTGLGAELHKQGELDAAAEAYLQSLAVFPDDGHVRHLLARVRLAQDRPTLALYDLELSLRLAPQHHDAEFTRRKAAQLRSRGFDPEPDEPPSPPREEPPPDTSP